MECAKPPKALKAVAAFELAKGGFALVGGVWFFCTLGDDWGIALGSMIERFAPSISIPERATDMLTGFDRNRQIIAAIALVAYAALHLVEGYGLWKTRHWAEWLGTISGGIYIPFEIWEMIEYPSWITATILAINTLIVGYLIYVIKTNSKRENAIS